VSALRSAEELPESIRPARFTIIDPTVPSFAAGADEKRQLLAAAPDERQLIVVWTGEWRSDAFAIDAADAKSRV